MKNIQNIRKSVFETNSSSSHSLHISQEIELNDFLIPDTEGKITLNGGEFGWEHTRYNDALTKANYCTTAALIYDNNASYLDNKEQKIGNYTELVKKVISEQTLAKDVSINFSVTDWNHPNHSYIDHQSIEDRSSICNQLFEDQEKLRNFIFNKKCWLFLGNDNSTAPPNYYDVDVNFKYNLILDNKKVFAKLKENYTKEDLYNQLESLFEVLKGKKLLQFSKNEYWWLSRNDEDFNIDQKYIMIETNIYEHDDNGKLIKDERITKKLHYKILEIPLTPSN